MMKQRHGRTRKKFLQRDIVKFLCFFLFCFKAWYIKIFSSSLYVHKKLKINENKYYNRK